MTRYCNGLKPWRTGTRRLLLLPSEEADEAAAQKQQQQQHLQQQQSAPPEMSKGRKQALSLVVLTRCLNLSQLLDSQVS